MGIEKITDRNDSRKFFLLFGTGLEIGMSMTAERKDQLQELLDRYQKEQREFENHWLWKELETTPKAFFAHVRASVQKSGIEPHVWQQKLEEAKQVIETRVKEREEAKTVNFKRLKGLRV